MFEEDEVALGSGVHNPACIVTERGEYTLATYMSRMERSAGFGASAARQKSTLTHLLEAVAYLHGRSMVRTEGPCSHASVPMSGQLCRLRVIYNVVRCTVLRYGMHEHSMLWLDMHLACHRALKAPMHY